MDSEFISREEYMKNLDGGSSETSLTEIRRMEYEEWVSIMNGQAAGDYRRDKPMPLPKELNRRRVLSAFLDAFELIGGVPRLAQWGMDNPTEFYKLYARLLPSAQTDVQDAKDTVIKHVLPPSKLDE